MEVLNFNALINEEEENLFDYIECKVLFGAGDSEYTLTKKGACIVEGPPFEGGWIQWAYDYGLNGEYGVDDLGHCPEEIAAEIRERFEDAKYDWMYNAGMSEEDMATYKLLHKQYLAVVNLSKGIDVDESKRIIRDTYAVTSVNCLTRLRQVREEAGLIDDLQGSQLCAVLTGVDAIPSSDTTRTKTIEKNRRMYLEYESLIEKIYHGENANQNDGKKPYEKK